MPAESDRTVHFTERSSSVENISNRFLTLKFAHIYIGSEGGNPLLNFCNFILCKARRSYAHGQSISLLSVTFRSLW